MPISISFNLPNKKELSSIKNLSVQTKISLTILILINISALIGVLFFNWNAVDLLLAYWIESLVVGFYNILKMKKAREPSGFINASINGKTIKQNKVSLIPFFVVHYGMFMLFHLIFLLVFIFTDLGGLHTNAGFLKTLTNALILGAGLLVSHGISYKTNFINNKEYKKISVSGLFYAPYKRIFAMQFAIILGAIFGAPAVILIIFKTIIDVFSHLMERQRFKRLK